MGQVTPKHPLLPTPSGMTGQTNNVQQVQPTAYNPGQAQQGPSLTAGISQAQKTPFFLGPPDQNGNNGGPIENNILGPNQKPKLGNNPFAINPPTF